MGRKILIVDDELDIQSSLSIALREEGFQVVTCTLPKEAELIVQREKIDVALLDVWFPEGDGIELLEWLRNRHQDIIPVMMSGHGTIELALKAVRLGAYDFLEKPIELEKLLVVLKNAVEVKSLREHNAYLNRELFQDVQLVGNSERVADLKIKLQKAAFSSEPVLLEGEKGVGKELAGRIIHNLGSQKQFPFVSINCATTPVEYLKDELFCSSGSPLGTRKQGVFYETKEGGSVFLNEVASLPPEMQVQLNQVLETGHFFDAHSSKKFVYHGRIFASSSVPSKDLCSQKSFNEDLFSQFGAIQIEIPSLNNRKEDLNEIIDLILQRLAKKSGISKPGVGEELMIWMKHYDWPGNVRELKNLLERMIIFSNDSGVLTMNHLPEDLVSPPSQDEAMNLLPSIKDPQGSLRSLRSQFEKMIIEQRLEKYSGHVTKAAESLGIERAHLHRKMKQYEIQVNRHPH